MKFILLAALALGLSACTANMKASKSVTSRGFIDTTGYTLGEVLLWDVDAKRLQPMFILDGFQGRLSPEVEAASDSVNFATSIKFAGNLDLTAVQVKALEAEVTSRTTAELTDYITRKFLTVVGLVESDWDARPDVWNSETGITGEGWPEDGSPIHVVVINDQTLAKRLEVKIEGQAALNGTFESAVSSAVGGTLDFKVIDTISINKSNTGGERSPVFFNPTIVRITRGATGSPQFTTRAIDPVVRAEVGAYLLQ